MLRRSVRRRFAWLALFALLVGSLLPSVAHVGLDTGRPGVWLADVCSTDTTSSAPGSGSGDQGNHCPYCCSAGSAPVLAAPSAPVPAAVVGDEARPAIVRQTPRLILTGFAPPSRAPPFAS